MCEFIDVRTLSYVFVWVHLIYLLVFSIAIIKDNQPYMQYLVLGLVINNIGFYLISIHEKNMNFVIYTANSLLVLGNIVLAAGIFDLTGLKVKKLYILYTFLVHLILHFYPTILKSNYFIRTTFFSIEIFCICIFLAMILIVFYIKTKYYIVLVPVGISCGVGIVHLIRILSVMEAITLEELFASDKMVSMMYFSTIIFLVGMYTSALLIQSKIYSEKYREKNAILKKAAFTDYLTKSDNLRALTKHLKREMLKVKDKKRVFTFAIIDLDHFKSVNDRFGHIIGDEVLKITSTLFKENLRRRDIFGRYGGEEFLVIFPGSSLEKSKTTLLGLQEILKKYNWKYDGLEVNFSAGIVEVSSENENIDDYQLLLKEADNLLYLAKTSGRGRIES